MVQTAAVSPPECDIGYVQSGTVCEPCAVGQFYSQARYVSGRGMYSPGCQACPTGTTTKSAGATSREECREYTRAIRTFSNHLFSFSCGAPIARSAKLALRANDNSPDIFCVTHLATGARWKRTGHIC